MALISIVGVGAIGGAVAGHLGHAGWNESMQLCARQTFEYLSLQFPHGQLQIKPKVFSQPGQSQRSQWVFVSTKAHQVDSAQAWLNHLCSSSTRVAVLQNGVEHESRVKPYINDAQVLPVVVDCPSVREMEIKNNTLTINQKGAAILTVENSPLGIEFKTLFENSAVEIKLTDDFTTEAWKKLCLNVAGGAIAALTDQALAVLHQPGMAKLAEELILECIAVGRCEGANLNDSLASDIVNSMLLHSKESLTSMLVDRRAGKILEVDARNGAVVRLGEKHGIHTPLNKMATTLLASMNQ